MTRFYTKNLCVTVALITTTALAQTTTTQNLETALVPAQAVTCPSQHFPEFFATFRDKIAIQKQFTKWPLTWCDYKNDSEKVAITNKNAAQIEWPLIATAAERHSYNLIEETSSLANQRYKVRMAVKDADHYIIEYSLYKLDSCWRLTWVDDLAVY